MTLLDRAASELAVESTLRSAKFIILKRGVAELGGVVMGTMWEVGCKCCHGEYFSFTLMDDLLETAPPKLLGAWVKAQIEAKHHPVSLRPGS